MKLLLLFIGLALISFGVGYFVGFSVARREYETNYLGVKKHNKLRL